MIIGSIIIVCVCVCANMFGDSVPIAKVEQ